MPGEEDLRAAFDGLPAHAVARFRAATRRNPAVAAFPDGFARLSMTSRFGEHALSYRSAWHLADPATERPMPSDAQIARVIGTPDPMAFRLGGATLLRRLEAYLQQRLERPLAGFDAVLDWGCGAGRLSRYLGGRVRRLTGADIDPDNVAACAAQVPEGRFAVVGRDPPMPFADASFDLVVGVSVLTHLAEADQQAWLAELRRVTRPRGIVVLSVQGAVQSCLYRDSGAEMLRAQRDGVHVLGANPQLDGVLALDGYYKDVRHSADYLLATLAADFDVLDHVPGLIALQDAVVLRRR